VEVCGYGRPGAGESKWEGLREEGGGRREEGGGVGREVNNRYVKNGEFE